MKVLHERSKRQGMKIRVEKVTKATFKFQLTFVLNNLETSVWKYEKAAAETKTLFSLSTFLRLARIHLRDWFPCILTL